jgi:hypothetical protein
VVDEGTSAIEPGVLWQGSTLVLYLRDPDMNIIGPTTTNPDIQYVAGPTYSTYRIQKPKPGLWELYVHGLDLPADPEAFFGYIIAYSDLTFDVKFDADRYDQGSPMTIQATLTSGGQAIAGEDAQIGGPITDATVTAAVRIPGTVDPAEVNFVHQGGGVYAATFMNTSVAGSYDFTIAASREGTGEGDSYSFTREIHRSVLVTSPFDPQVVVLATNSARLSSGVTVTSGDVVVNATSTPCLDGPALQLRRGTP